MGKLKAIVLAGFRGCVELLLYAPLLIQLGVLTVPDDGLFLWWFTLPIYYVAGYTLRSLWRIETRFGLTALGVVIVGGLSYVFSSGSMLALVSGFAIGALLYYRGSRMSQLPWNITFPIRFYWFGLVTYAYGSIAFPSFDSLSGYKTTVYLLGFAALAVALLVSNEMNLKNETLSGSREAKLSRGVVWKNRILILLALALVMLIGSWKALAGAVTALKEKIIALYQSLIDRIIPNKPSGGVSEMPTGSALEIGQITAEETDPSAFVLFLQKMGYYVVAAILIGAVIFILYLGIRLLRKWIKRLVAWMSERMNRRGDDNDGGFVDEKSNVFDWDALKKQWSDSAKSGWKKLFDREPKWEQLKDNRERVRFLYRMKLQEFMGEGYRFESAKTPGEVGSDVERWRKEASIPAWKALIPLYYEARYGDKELTGEKLRDVIQLRDSGKR
ncbi:hypothetical protein [Paenibacillus koleovorans]|uniref:hypothetical protein n=1 Tax=Paenibacillus koleovorans TaxID=121608 RepID=UPI000FD78CC7|nr:hypothetical protein [Paenibacillus koleovorans]